MTHYRKILFALLIAALAPHLYSQQVLQQRKFDDLIFVRYAGPFEDGYLLLGMKLKDPDGPYERSNKLCYLVRLDAGMQTVWEKALPVNTFLNPENLIVAEDGFYVLGFAYPDGGKQSSAVVVKMDGQGRQLYRKIYHCKGHHSTEGSAHGTVLPNGHLLLSFMAFPNYNSLGNPWLIELDEGGEIVQEAFPGKTQFYTYVNEMKLLDDGRVVLGGGSYPSMSAVKESQGRAWFQVLSPDRLHAPLVNKYLEVASISGVQDFLPLDNGGFWLLGHGQGRPLLVEVDANMQVVHHQDLSHSEKVRFLSFAWNAARSSLVLVGQSGPGYEKEVLFVLDGNWNVLETQVNGKGRFLEVQPFESGEVLVTAWQGLLVYR